MPTLRAICLAQGAPLGTIGSITNPTAAQANIVVGGNIDLKPETASTWTLGVVFLPEFLPKFSVSVDYYNIRVKDVIGAATPGDLINACFGNITRRPARRIRTAWSFGATRSPAASTAIRRSRPACSVPRPIWASCSPTVST